MKKIIYALVVIFIVIFAGVVYKISIDTKKDALKLDNVSLRLKWINQAQFSGYYLANSQKLYDDKGLNVEINPGGPDISPVQMVATGVNHFGITGADQIILAREKGIPLVALAVIYKNSPIVVMSLAEKNIKEPKDLIGKKVEVVYGRDEEVIYDIFLKKAGIDRKTINEMPTLTDFSMITSGQSDARVEYKLNGCVLLSLQGFNLNIIEPSDYGIKFYADTLFTTEKMIQEKPEVVRKFVQASIEGWKIAIADQPKAIDELMKINSILNREHQTKFLEQSIPLIIGDGEIGYSNKDVWTEMQEALLEQGLQKSAIDIDKVFTNEFLKPLE